MVDSVILGTTQPSDEFTESGCQNFSGTNNNTGSNENTTMVIMERMIVSLRDIN